MLSVKSILIASLLFMLSFGSYAMAESPLPHLTSSRKVSPVCVVSGLPEDKLHIFQDRLCAEVSHLLAERGINVEILAINDARITDTARLVLGLRFHVEAVDDVGTFITMSGQLTGNARLIPGAAHIVPFDASDLTVTPALSECLRRLLKEEGLI